ncbi:Hypothetical predicted protein [Octopus vulgaris]|uniref:Uncharacterized protein n=1 Tax=Octopus vulgaris TaxID=6645 RepID=A0AA36F1B4_OCTVU|nr:Hypothetical predicted protein [Octopus vulgaris]
MATNVINDIETNKFDHIEMKEGGLKFTAALTSTLTKDKLSGLDMVNINIELNELQIGGKPQYHTVNHSQHVDLATGEHSQNILKVDK